MKEEEIPDKHRVLEMRDPSTAVGVVQDRFFKTVYDETMKDYISAGEMSIWMDRLGGLILNAHQQLMLNFTDSKRYFRRGDKTLSFDGARYTYEDVLSSVDSYVEKFFMVEQEDTDLYYSAEIVGEFLVLMRSKKASRRLKPMVVKKLEREVDEALESAVSEIAKLSSEDLTVADILDKKRKE